MQYADGTLLLCACASLAESSKLLLNSVTNITHYYEQHALTLNEAKTEYIIVCKKHLTKQNQEAILQIGSHKSVSYENEINKYFEKDGLRYKI